MKKIKCENEFVTKQSLSHKDWDIIDRFDLDADYVINILNHMYDFINKSKKN